VIDIIFGDVFVVFARFRATDVVTLRCKKLSDIGVRGDSMFGEDGAPPLQAAGAKLRSCDPNATNRSEKLDPIHQHMLEGRDRYDRTVERLRDVRSANRLHLTALSGRKGTLA
jgi:hypothetical protein